MREILFRGKTFAGKWIEGFLFQMCGDCVVNWCISRTPICANDYSDILGDWAEVIPESISEFSGLTDKNGKKIFEGDIVKIYLYEPKGLANYEIGCIKYDDTKARFIFYTEEGNYGIDNSNVFEVIGNIHDNPELVKGGEG